MFRFANTYYLFFLFIIPILLAVIIWYLYNKKKAIGRFGNPELLEQLMPDVSKSKPYIKYALLLIALACIIIALARPQFGSKLQEVKREGIELIIALDVSNSMLAEDLHPNRLEID